MTGRAYVVELREEEGGPEPWLRDRLAIVIERRFHQLQEQQGVSPKAGDVYDVLDAFEGKYVGEMTGAELEAATPTRVDVEVLDVDPAEPADSGVVHVRVRVRF